MTFTVLLTCEHASNQIPSLYQTIFAQHADILSTHHAIDLGALQLLQELQALLNCASYVGEYSRLLIDLNRNLNNKSLFSNITKTFSENEKEYIIDNYYKPFRDHVCSTVGDMIAKGCTVLHISVHSFTPVLHGKIRTADIGLLYDPARALEKHFCKNFGENIKRINPNYNVKMNYPYKGTNDGLVTFFRKKFAATSYLGIEIEMNQKFFLENEQADINKTICTALQACLA